MFYICKEESVKLLFECDLDNYRLKFIFNEEKKQNKFRKRKLFN